jgi:hypothetical protein
MCEYFLKALYIKQLFTAKWVGRWDWGPVPLNPTVSSSNADIKKGSEREVKKERERECLSKPSIWLTEKYVRHSVGCKWCHITKSRYILADARRDAGVTNYHDALLHWVQHSITVSSKLHLSDELILLINHANIYVLNRSFVFFLSWSKPCSIPPIHRKPRC